MEQVCCIVPAAGRSARMGAWKPLLPFRESTIIRTVVQTALRACARVLVVTGYRGAELAVALEGLPGVHLLDNPDWEKGMFSSIQVGAREVSSDRFFIVLGDLPFIASGTYAALLSAPPADAVFPVFDGRRGHPVLLGPAVREAVLAAAPGAGSMREIIAGFSIREVAWPNDSILRDIDTPGQYSASLPG